ncbi:NAD-P-binding protein [Earliella scabrosa]|nr:NAD-P-binding protein [Earliella scabrosa]
MPAITSGKVLVTGANGFVGAWIVKAFLDAGFAVRAVVRDESKTVHLKKVFAEHGDKLEFALVPDMTKEGPYDEAATGVDAIVHTASPVGLGADEPDDFIVPAVQGVLGALRAAARSSSVKRVVSISSCVTIVDETATSPRVYDETCWNEDYVPEVEAKGRAASGMAKYGASKIIAERKGWEFYEQAKVGGAECHWDLTVFVPPWVFGPMIHEFKGEAEKLNVSCQFWYNGVVKGTLPASYSHLWVDVRDLARAFVLAVTTPAAGGERIIVSAGSFRLSDFVLAARRVTDKVPAPTEPYDADAVYAIQHNGAKAKEILGATYRSMEDTCRDIVSDYEARGLL